MTSSPISAGRLLGTTASGPPPDSGDGTFQPGDFVLDLTGTVFVCASPGAWVASVPADRVLPPVVLSAPQVAGTPSAGQTLTCSPGTWSGSPPITFAYQWKSDGIPILAASAATYAIAAADVAATLTCDVTAANPAGQTLAASAPVTVLAPAGTLRFAADCASAAPFTADGGGLQDDTNTPSSGWHYRGHITFGVVKNGRACCQLTVPEDPPAPDGSFPYTYGACQLQMGHLAVPHWNDLGPYLGGALYIPPGGLIIAGGGSAHSVNFGELNFQGTPISKAPLTYYLTPDHLGVDVLAGIYNPATRTYQYSPASTPSARHDVIPPGVFSAHQGSWVSWITRINWAIDATGEIEHWYRPEGGAWVSGGVQYTGKPTWVWPSGSTPALDTPSGLTQPAFNYLSRPPDGAGATTLWRCGWYVGDTWDVVAAQLP